MPYVMGLEGPPPTTVDRILGELYAAAPRSVLLGLSGPFDAIKARPLVLVLGFVAGLWFAGSRQGQELVRKVFP
jgi:hypothetical protein